MTDGFETDRFDAQIEALDAAMSNSSVMASAFETELRRMEATFADTGRQVSYLQSSISSGLRRAIDGLVFDGDKLSDALRRVGESMLDAAYSAAMRPVTNHVGGLLATAVQGVTEALTPFANGASFSQGRVMPFARGGVVSGPTNFPMRNGTGLMGEAGPEAIMPLSRGADGKLGVRAESGRAINIVMNVKTPDVEGFARSQSQIAAQLTRAIGRGQRNR